MALIHIDGFDHYGDDETKLTEGVYESIDSSFAISSTNPRTGSRCIRRDTTVSRHYIVKDLGTQNQTIGMGFSFFIDQLPDNENSYVLCDLRDQNGDVQIEVLIQDDGSIDVRLTSGIVIGSSTTGIVSANSFNHFEIGVYFDSGTTGGTALLQSFDGDFSATDPDDITTSKEIPPTNNISISTSPENTITVTLPEGRTFEAWNAWGEVNLPSTGWLNGFYYKADGALAEASDLTRYATPTEAIEAFDSFSLTGFSNYIIYLFDSPINDNLGGLSIHVDVFAPTSIGPEGIVECRLNGVTIISESGIRTTSTENNECSKVSLAGGWSIVHGVTTDFDDWYVWNDAGSWNNSFIGDRRCFLLKPNQDTNISDFNPSSGNFGYKMIDDESPDDDATYIIAEAYLQSGSPASGTSEFEIEDLTIGSSLISGINVISRASKTDNTSAELYTSINSGANSISNDVHILTTSYNYYSDIYEYDPLTISSMTKGGFDNLSISITADDLSTEPPLESPDAVGSPTDNDAPFSPDDIASLFRWYDADSLSLTDGDPVSSWTDISPNADHAVQATGSKQPTYRTGIINGYPVVRFITNDVLEFSEIFDTSSSTGTIFVVGKIRTGGSAPGVWLSTRNSTSTGGWTFRGNSTTTGAYFHVAVASVNLSYSDQFNLMEVKRNGLDIDTYVNGTLDSSATLSSYFASSYNKTSIGAETAGAATFLDGDIAEIIIYDEALSDTDRGNVEAYLLDKYGIV